MASGEIMAPASYTSRSAYAVCIAVSAAITTLAVASAPSIGDITLAGTPGPTSGGASDTALRILVTSVPLPAPGAPQPVFEWLAKSGWAWGLTVNWDAATQPQIEAVWRAGLVPVLDVHASNSTRARQAKDHGRQSPALAPVLETHLAAAAAVGQPPSALVWKAFEEEDSAGVAFPWDEMAAGMRARVNTSAQAFRLWDGHLGEAFAEAQPWVGKGVNLWARVGFAVSPHSLARRGARTVLVERANDDLGDLLPAIAFARGAAAQFGLPAPGWGIDMSQWWGPINGCVERLPALYHRRQMYAAMAAGAGVMGFEGCSWMNASGQLYALPAELDAFGRLAARESSRARMGEPDAPVAVMLPQDHGWVVPPYWATSTDDVYWSFARLSRPRGMRGVDGVFGAAWPGAAFASQPYPFGPFDNDTVRSPSLGYVPPKWAPAASDTFYTPFPLPFTGRFHSRADADAFMHSGPQQQQQRQQQQQSTQGQHRVGATVAAGGVETSPFRPTADTRWGAILDVLTDDASATALARYEVLVLAGPVTVSAALEARLTAYVKAGGVLVWAIGVATPAHAALTGLAFTGEMRAGRAWVWQGEGRSEGDGQGDRQGRRREPGQTAAIAHEPLLYVLAEASTDVTTLASTPGGDPLVVRNAPAAWAGGAVYTVTVPWLEGAAQSGGASLAGPALALLDWVVGAVQPVTVAGLPVQWHVSTVRSGSDLSRAPGARDTSRSAGTTGQGAALSRTVTLLNNDGAAWTGTVTIHALTGCPPSKLQCADVRSGMPIAASAGAGASVSVQLSVPGYDVAVVRCGLLPAAA